MAKYRQISPKIWNDAKFRSLSDNGKLVFFMLLTHPHTSAIGTLRSFIPGLAAELGWSEKAFREAFREALSKGMCKADERAGLVWLPNFAKYNLPQSPNVLKSWSGALDDCPECSLKNEVFQSLKILSGSLSEAFRKAFNEAFRDPYPNKEQEQEQEQEQEIINPKISGSDKQVDSTTSEKQMPDKSGSSVRKIPEEYLSFAREFQALVANEKGNLAPKVTDSLIKNGAIELERAIRIEKIDWQELQAALIWGRNAYFWERNLLSLANLRSPMKNGIKKVQGVVADYRRSLKPQPERSRQKTFEELEEERVARIMAEAEERDRQRELQQQNNSAEDWQ